MSDNGRFYGVFAGILFLGIAYMFGRAAFYLAILELVPAFILSSSAPNSPDWRRYRRDLLVCTCVGLVALVGVCAYEPRIFAPLRVNVVVFVIGFGMFAVGVALFSAIALIVARLLMFGHVGGWPSNK